MQSRQTVLLCLLLAGVVSVMGATKPLTTTPVIMFDNKDYSGDSQNFPVAMPYNGCSPCTSLNLIKTNSWESYVAGNGTSIQLFDSRSCTGTTSGKVATWGVIQGTLADSVDSIILCDEPRLPLPASSG
ncbi:TPA: hypothetical protein ACH3X1_006101 [Trebouxia sp. C0004]